MFHKLLICLLFLTAAPNLAFAESIEGELSSIDAEGRTVSLISGEIFAVGEEISIDSLVVGQVIRINCEDGTTHVTSIDIVAAAVDETPPTNVDVVEPEGEDTSVVDTTATDNTSSDVVPDTNATDSQDISSGE
ncbi:DUF1344 domain-containing protein [Rhizobium alvei]|uniref:DUF5666 domain-containing protein n=1 Tax=Rhizobium alvei TaxID=1132659 RepID=A0ABT8YNN8_9HYPH|nr:hypothetical protein [Rhizobium alvei]MDO6965231.1 hypothetical protein [Rhizobium alvei]